MLLVVRYMLRFWGAVGRERRDLVIENIALRHQPEVLTRNQRRPEATVVRWQMVGW